MENIVLLIVVAFLVVMALSGYRRGFLKILLSMVALILTLVLSSMFTPNVAKLLKEYTPLYDTINEQMVNFVGNKIEDSTKQEEASIQEQALEALPLPETITSVLVENNNNSSYTELGVSDFTSYTAESLTVILMNAISYIAIFIVISILFRILMIMADIVSKIPIINGVNRLAGTILGIVEGFLILWVLCIALTAISGTAIGQQIVTMVNDSEFLSYIYNHNMIANIFTGIFNLF